MVEVQTTLVASPQPIQKPATPMRSRAFLRNRLDWGFSVSFREVLIKSMPSYTMSSRTRASCHTLGTWKAVWFV